MAFSVRSLLISVCSTYDDAQEGNMQSIQRSIMLLRPGDGPHINPQSRGTLKLQALPAGLTVQLSTIGLEPGEYALYLFLQDGAAIFAGDVTIAGLRRVLPGIRRQNVAGAAVIHSASLSFCLKSTNMDWKEAQPRFKMLHASHQARPEQPKPEDEAPAAAEPPAEPSAKPEDKPPADTALPAEASHKPENEAPTAAEPSVEPSPEPSAESAPLNDSPGVFSGQMPDMPPSAEKTDEYPPKGVPEVSDEEASPCENCPYAARQQYVNPFPTVFPHSEWTKMTYPGPAGWWHYITGRIYTDSNTVIKAVGVPGEYGMMPPVWLEGFGTYLRCNSPDAHGYWLMFQDAETGEIMDMGLSPRDA
jgi:outer membrane biosynthesis protein TonB